MEIYKNGHPYGTKRVNIRVMSNGRECVTLEDLLKHFNLNDVIDVLDFDKDNDSRMERWLRVNNDDSNILKGIQELRKKYAHKEIDANVCLEVIHTFRPKYCEEYTSPQDLEKNEPIDKDDYLGISVCQRLLRTSQDMNVQLHAVRSLRKVNKLDDITYYDFLDKAYDNDKTFLNDEEKKKLGVQLFSQNNKNKKEKGKTILEPYKNEKDIQSKLEGEGLRIIYESVESTITERRYKELLESPSNCDEVSYTNVADLQIIKAVNRESSCDLKSIRFINNLKTYNTGHVQIEIVIDDKEQQKLREEGCLLAYWLQASVQHSQSQEVESELQKRKLLKTLRVISPPETKRMHFVGAKHKYQYTISEFLRDVLGSAETFKDNAKQLADFVVENLFKLEQPWHPKS